MNRRPILAACLVTLLAAAWLLSAPPSVVGAYGETPRALIPYPSSSSYRFFRTPITAKERAKSVSGESRVVTIGLLIPPPDAPLGPEGLQVRRGVMLAAEEASRVPGARPVRVIVHADQPVWGASGSEVVKMAYSEHALAMIGSVGGGSSHIAARVALKAMLPMVTTAATDPSLTETRIPWLFRTIPDDRRQSYALLHLLVTERGFRRIALLRSSDRDDRVGCRELRDGARRLGMPLVAELQYPRGTRNFATYLQQIRWSKPQAILLRGLPTDVALALRQLRSAGMKEPVAGWSSVVTPRFLHAAGDSAEGFSAIATMNPGREEPAWERFRKLYHDRYGEAPEALAAHAYDGMKLLLGAIHRAGPQRLAIRDALAATDSFTGAAGPLVFDATMNDLGPVYVATVRNGAFVYRPAALDVERKAP